VCPAGFVDADGDAATACEPCDDANIYVPPGSAGNCMQAAVVCGNSTSTDFDRNASTPCSTSLASVHVRAVAVVAIVIPAAVGGAVLLVLLLAVWVYRQRHKRRPFSFEDEMNELRLWGVCSFDSLNKQDHSPREIPRKYFKMLHKIGAGAFGDVHKALIHERERGIPEYVVAVKVLW
jgi:hypothetical protein